MSKIEKKNNLDNGKVLFTFVGATDPTRGLHDGPIIHICRYNRPCKIYMILTKEMEKRDDKGIYQDSIHANIKDYYPEIIRIKTDIVEAHKFDKYFKVVNDTFKRIKDENPEDTEILVNISSGTAQMTTNVVSYIITSMDNRIKPVQVETPERKGNTEKSVNEDYDVQEEAEVNFDNEEGAKCRLLSPDLTRYSRNRVIRQIYSLLEFYDYGAIKELIKPNIFKNQKKLNLLLNIGIERKNLLGVSINNKVKDLKDKKYSNLKYYEYDKKDPQVPIKYRITDYYALAYTKLEIEDISGYVLMLEPFAVNLYLSVLEDLLKINLKDLFTVVNNRKVPDVVSYRIAKNKLNKELIEAIETYLNIEYLRDGDFVSDKVLIAIINYYLKQKNMNIEGFDNLSNDLNRVKPIRNDYAHNMKNYNEQELKKLTGVNLNHLNKNIMKFLKLHFGYSNQELYLYKNINNYIVEILEEEK